MLGNEDSNTTVKDQNALVIEYVCGTMRDTERVQFERDLATNDTLHAEVRFWEEQLMEMQSGELRPPQPQTWKTIEQRVNQTSTKIEPSTEKDNKFSFWQWLAPTIAACCLMAVMFGYNPTHTPAATSPQLDYLAVLTNQEAKAVLTAISSDKEKAMWLKWDTQALKQDTHAQLWAISRRDGETRPIAVLDDVTKEKLPLDEARWRLITDAEFLILTEEEIGGSAIDEPSDIILAKGFCVRFSKAKPKAS